MKFIDRISVKKFSFYWVSLCVVGILYFAVFRGSPEYREAVKEAERNRFVGEVVLTANIDGQPERISKQFGCYQEVIDVPTKGLHIKWLQSTHVFSERLKSGKWLLFFTQSVRGFIFRKTSTEIFTILSWIAISDDLESPTFEEIYRPSSIPFLRSTTSASSVDLSTLQFEYAATGIDFDSFRPRLEAQEEEWENSGSGNRMLASGQFWVIPRRIWENEEYLKKYLTESSGAQEIILSEPDWRKLNSKRFKLEAENRQLVLNGANPPSLEHMYHPVPLRPIGKDRWELDFGQAGKEVAYFVATKCGVWDNNRDRTSGCERSIPEWKSFQTIYYGGIEISNGLPKIVYDSRNKRLIHRPWFSVRHR